MKMRWGKNYNCLETCKLNNYTYLKYHLEPDLRNTPKCKFVMCTTYLWYYANVARLLGSTSFIRSARFQHENFKKKIRIYPADVTKDALNIRWNSVVLWHSGFIDLVLITAHSFRDCIFRVFRFKSRSLKFNY